MSLTLMQSLTFDSRKAPPEREDRCKPDAAKAVALMA